MAFHPEFQPLCGQIIHRDPVHSLYCAISDLVIEETRLHSLFSLASTLTSESETVLAVTPWSSSSEGPRSMITIKLYCTIYKRTGHTDRLCRHSRSCNHCKMTGHTRREYFNFYPKLLVQSQQRRKQQGLPPFCTSSAGSRVMSASTI